MTEALNPDRGLFLSKDGGRTIQPNAHASLAAGADNATYFALLGKVSGLALYHREPLAAAWSSAFIKAVFEFEIRVEDFESVDPELYKKRVAYLRDSAYEAEGVALSDLCLSFVDDTNQEEYSASSDVELNVVELKAGGRDIEVTEENKEEYLRLFVHHRLVGAIKPQLDAFRAGLSVFVGPDLRKQLRACCPGSTLRLINQHTHACVHTSTHARTHTHTNTRTHTHAHV